MTHKSNNVIPNGHFHKKWQRRIRTWFNQPARKNRRKVTRRVKAVKIAPRPTSSLRSMVHCPTIRYNKKVRLGRGFSLEEIRRLGLCRQFARSIGVSVDHRRRNKSVDSLLLNVQRLKEYLSKLILFPKKNSVKIKKGEAGLEEQKLAVQLTDKRIVPLTSPWSMYRARAVADEDLKFSAYAAVRKARIDLLLQGKRAKRLKAALENPENFGKSVKKGKESKA